MRCAVSSWKMSRPVTAGKSWITRQAVSSIFLYLGGIAESYNAAYCDTCYRIVVCLCRLSHSGAALGGRSGFRTPSLQDASERAKMHHFKSKSPKNFWAQPPPQTPVTPPLVGRGPVADLGEGQGGRPPPGSESGPKWAPLGPLE